MCMRRRRVRPWRLRWSGSSARRCRGGSRPMGGVRPRQGRGAGNGKRLAFEDRCAIEAGLAVTESQASIARRIGFSAATVSREITRGRLNSGRYSAKRGQAVAVEDGRRPKSLKLVESPRLRARVEEDLGKRYSPQQISARLRLGLPPTSRRCGCTTTRFMRPSTSSPRGALRADLAKNLRSGGSGSGAAPGAPMAPRSDAGRSPTC